MATSWSHKRSAESDRIKITQEKLGSKDIKHKEGEAGINQWQITYGIKAKNLMRKVLEIN